jgi:hypothetical protein
MPLKTPFRLLIGFITILQVVTTITYYTVTHFHSLHASLFSLSAVVFAYSVSLSLKHLNSLQLFFTYDLLVTVSYRELLCRAEQSSSLLPATSQHGHSWHRAPLGPMVIYLFNVKTFVFLSLLSLFLVYRAVA